MFQPIDAHPALALPSWMVPLPSDASSSTTFDNGRSGTLTTRRVLPVAFVPLTGPNAESR